MHIRRLVVGVCVVSAALAMCIPVAGASAAGDGSASRSARGWVQQIGTFDYLVSPNYTGLAQISDIAAQATLGLGTFNNLSGELVLVDGVVYRVSITGHPQPVPTTRTTPFMEAIAFRPQVTQRIPRGTACSQLPAMIDAAVGTSSGMVAVRVSGVFRALQTRSVEGQRQPYPPLADVVAQQTVFTLDGRDAVLVGFRTGADLAGVGPQGLHLHGVTAERDAGGHVLACVTGRGVTMRLQLTRGVRIHH